MSTAQIEAVFVNNAGYRESRSTTMALAYISAAEALLLIEANSMGKGGSMVSFDRTMLERAISRAQAYVTGFSPDDRDRPGPNVTRVSFNGFR